MTDAELFQSLKFGDVCDVCGIEGMTVAGIDRFGDTIAVVTFVVETVVMIRLDVGYAHRVKLVKRGEKPKE